MANRDVYVDFTFNNATIKGIPTPVNATDVANKAYVDLKQDITALLTAYVNLSATSGTIEKTGANTLGTYVVTAAGKALIDDADATAQRGTLGLGSLATLNNISASNFTSQTAATFLAAPNAAAGVPSFRAIVAADIPTLNQSTTGSAATLTTTRSIAMSGDVVWTVNFNGSANVTAAGTIQTGVVSNAKLATVPTASFKGRITAATGAPEDLTATQATSLLNTFTTSLKGLVPASGAGAGTTFLRDDGVWAVPSGGGGSTGKQTIFIPASAINPRISSGPSIGSFETPTNKINVPSLDFDASVQEHAQFIIAMPKSWNEGQLSYEVIWYHPTTTTNFGVTWVMEAIALSDTNALDTSFGSQAIVSDTGGVANTLYDSPESSLFTVGNVPAENDTVIFQIYRLPSDANDTMAVDARLIGIRLFYTTNAGNDA